MCGRFAIFSSLKGAMNLIKLLEESGSIDDLLEEEGLIPNWNCSPGNRLPVVRRETGITHLTAMRWGLVPSWAKDRSIGSKLINARAETLAGKPSFRNALGRRHCLIPANGFYEWRKSDRQPLFIHLPEDPLFFIGGLWDRWNDENGTTVETFTIVTTEANPFMVNIHDRMPLIFTDRDIDIWLSIPREQVPAIAQSYSGPMKAHPVSRMVNKTGINIPDLVLPVETEEIPLLFESSGR